MLFQLEIVFNILYLLIKCCFYLEFFIYCSTCLNCDRVAVVSTKNYCKENFNFKYCSCIQMPPYVVIYSCIWFQFVVFYCQQDCITQFNSITLNKNFKILPNTLFYSGFLITNYFSQVNSG